MKHLTILAALAAALFLTPLPVEADGDAKTFETPEAAAAALQEAATAHDVEALVALVGAKHRPLFDTGDANLDRAERTRFADAADERLRIERGDDGVATVYVGYADWAFPVPLRKGDGGWQFDGEAGREAVLDRKIGANEIAAMTMCRAIYMAQGLYHLTDHDGDGVLEYATRLVSRPDAHDGLYWDPKPGEPASPLGRVLGVSGDGVLGAGPGARWMGYRFRLLARQGPTAPGGAYGYKINGNMVSGFGILATPQAQGETGIAGFLMGPNGVLFQRDLRADTRPCSATLGSYSPDAGWVTVE